MGIEQRVLHFIRRHSLVEGGSKILVAVSGGPDSVCLLHVMYGLRQELDMELHVAHMNHLLRARKSDADAAYVADLSQRLGVSFTIESRDVRKYRAESRTSLEEAARNVRYSFLAEVADKVGAERVAVGHTDDDHVETILMHLLRGSGIRGLRGLQPANIWSSPGTNITIVRPLLEVSRKETADYCRRHGMYPRQDSSNLSIVPMRNRIRHHLLPELKRYNPRIKEALLRTARIAADDLAFIDGEAARLLPAIVRKHRGCIIIDKKSFNTLPASLKRYLLRSSIENLLGNLKDIEAGHIEGIIDALDKPAGKLIGLPCGLNFTIEYDRYVLGPDAAVLSAFPALGPPVELQHGKTEIPGWVIEAEIVASTDIKTPEEADEFAACFDYDKTGNRLIVRSRKPGDSFQPLGMDRRKKLNEYMIDARIPRPWRRCIPLVVSSEHIIWVVGWRIDERVKVTRETRKVLRIRFKPS